MTSAPAATAPADRRDHGRRVVVAWIALSLVATPIVAFVLGPSLPPGNGSAQATEQVFDNTWITAIVTPVICLLIVFFVYALSQFRHTGGQLVDGPPLRHDNRIQVLWIAITAVVVMFLAGFGSYELLQNGAGGGQGPNPIAVPSGQKLQVQVIGQQWAWTFRYPAYGGVETAQIAIPVNRVVAFHVTSLDVNHSFWAIQLGVKADAIPGTDNVAFVRARHTGTFEIRCAELCGLWHGHMHNTGVVMTQAGFARWIRGEVVANAPATKVLPPFATHYYPEPLRRAG